MKPEVLDLLERAVLCWLATVGPDGTPSVSPKEIFVAAPPDRVLIADIASPKSVANIAVVPRVCVAAIDVFDQRGYQLYGRARLIEPDDAEFAETVAPLRAMAGETFTVRRVIEVAVERTSPVVAPSYWARPDLDDATRRAGTLATYGVRPAD